MENQEENQINFAEVLSKDTFEGLKNVCEAFLKMQGLPQATLEFPIDTVGTDEEGKALKSLFKVYIRKLPEELCIHIVSSNKVKAEDIDFIKVPEDEKEDFED